MLKKLLLFFTCLIHFWSFGNEGYFLRNEGQLPDHVLYHARLNYGGFYVEKDGFKILVLDPKELDHAIGHGEHHHHYEKGHSHINKDVRGHVFTIKFKGSNPLNYGLDYSNLSFKVSSFIGNDSSKWVGGLTPIKETTLSNLYEGIDLKLSFKNNVIKYDFIVKPGANPNDINIEYEGLENIRHLKNKLILVTSVGNIEESAPYSFTSDQPNNSIPTEYKKITESTYGIELGDYDKSKTLTIDPQLNFITFSGSSSDNWGFSATYDNLGYGYGGGVTFGSSYPTTTGAYSSFLGGGSVDMSISKFSPDGTQLVASTYLGGNGIEAPHSMIVNSKGELLVYGASSSSDFPTVANSYDKTFNGGNYTQAGYLSFSNGTDIVLAKLSNDFTTLLSSTYYGGSNNDGINDGSETLGLFRNYGDGNRGEIIVDKNDNVLISSVTVSNDLPTNGGFQTSYGGGSQDGCVAKFNPNLSSLIFGSYFGGSGNDACYSIKQNSSGDIYISGGTTSTNLQQTSGSYSSSYSGSIDGFLARVHENGGTLIKTTYIGGSSYDQNYLVDVDKDESVYCFGQSAGNMTVSNGVYSNPGSKQFLQKYNKELTVLEKGTVFGNGTSQTELVPTALMVSDCKEVYVSGWGGSFNDYSSFNGIENFPITSDAIQSQTDGSDFYILVLAEDFQQINYGSFIGNLNASEHVDGGTSRFDRNGTIYQSVCACGSASTFPVTPGAYSEQNNSSCNLALIKMDASTLTANIQFQQDSIYCSNNIVNFTNISTGGQDFKWIYPDESVVQSRDGQFEFLEAGQFIVQLVATDPNKCPFSDTTEVLVDVAEGVNLDLQLDSYDCSTGDLSLSVEGPNTNDYVWSDANGVIPGNTNSISLSTDTNTLFYVEYEAGCGTVKDQIEIELFAPPTGGFANGTSCYGDSLKFYFETNENSTYKTINGEPYSLINDTLIFPTLSDESIYFETSSPCGTAVDTFDIDAIILESVTSPDTTVCMGERVPLSVISNEDFVWQNGGFPDPTANQQVIYPTESESYIVQLDNNICIKNDTINIDVFSTEEQPINPSYTIDFGESLNLNLLPGYAYSWNPGNYMSCNTCSDVSLEAQEDMTYTFEYMDSKGCLIKDSVVVNVIFPLWIPNSFTPNRDFKNEVFKAESHAVSEFTMYIFNRWGEVVFKSNDINSGWDGTIDGEPQQIDVYVYKIVYKKVHSDKHYEKTGTVTLMR